MFQTGFDCYRIPLEPITDNHKTMISESHYTNLENANRELALRFEKLKKARVSRDSNGIKNAEMEYFQSLQHLYTAVQDAVADGNHQSSRREG